MTAPRIYVGTYAKYNDGNIAGAWLDLADYSDREEFDQACRELHKDEHDPEFMFQDWEGIPYDMVSECHINDEVFNLAQMSEDDRELLDVYRTHVNQDGDLSEAKEAYYGTFNSKADAAWEFHDQTGGLASVPDFYRAHIDWDGIAREMELSGDWEFVEVGFEDCRLFRANV
jgi:antirestriction protein